MKCIKPVTLTNGLEVACSRCDNCQVNRRRTWVGRMILELSDHPAAAFVTLTYDEKHLPPGGSVWKKHVQLFLKRLRQEVNPRLLRYFAVGEYGTKSLRPHYHLILFGLYPTEGKVVQKCWMFGHSMTGTAEVRSIAYAGSYTMKKMYEKVEIKKLGLNPEFCLMSLKPGLGSGFLARAVKSLDGTQGTVKSVELKTIRFDGKKYPIGRYLRSKLNDYLDPLGTERREELQRIILELVEKEFEEGISNAGRRKMRERKTLAQKARIKKTFARRTL